MMKEEVAVLESCREGDEEAVRAKLAERRNRRRTTRARQFTVLSEALATVLDELSGDREGRDLVGLARAEKQLEEDLAAAEGVFATVSPGSGALVRVPPGRERPVWAKDSAPNCRG